MVNRLASNQLCVVNVALPGAWPAWYFARIVEYEEDEQGNWCVNKFKVAGESFNRDTHLGLFVIREADKQAKAEKLAATLWHPKAFKSADEIRKAILEVWL